MIITVELSLYPIMDDFDLHILSFIKKIRTYPELTVVTNTMSTYVQGDMEVVMTILGKELKTVYDKIDTTVTILKIVNRKLPISDGSYNFKS